jgi:predicted RND superfamily exporter protein
VPHSPAGRLYVPPRLAPLVGAAREVVEVVKKFIERLSELQIQRPWVPLFGVAVVTCILGLFASRLELRTRYDALLPDSQPSVQELHRVEARTASAQTLLILLEARDPAVLRAMGDAVSAKLTELGPDFVSSAEDGTRAARAFLTPRAGLFLSVAEVEQLRSDVFARWDYEVAREADQLLDDSGPPVTMDQIEKRLRKKADAAGAEDHSDGYYARKDGTGLVVVVRSPVPGGDLARTGPALAKMEGAVAVVKASQPAYAQVRVGYAGDMATGFIEYDRIRNDLLGVGAKGIALVLAAVLLYFMRVRALFVMGVTIAIGLVWTLGFTQIFIGHLNVATGFLISIIAGNGINVGILYQSRYFEERRAGAPAAEALKTAVRATWQPTVIAALAAAASYLSLLVTDFRAFKHFGIIAATGMLLCWVVKTLAVPPLLVLLERRRPISYDREPGWLGAARRFGMGYGRAFAWLVPKAPAALFGGGVLLVVAGVVTGVLYVRRDPMEYDLGATENDPSDNPELHRVWDGVIEILGAGHEGMVVLTDTPEEAKELQDKLQADWDRAPEGSKPFVAVHTLWSAVPDDQAVKLPILREVGERLERARTRGFLSDADWAKVKDYILPADVVRPYGLADLPEPLARPFAEKDGTRGRLVVIEPEPSKSNDLRYLLRYSDSFRETRLASGKIVRGSGRAFIFSDILQAVVRDVRKAVGLSLGLTLLAVAITFRGGGRHALSVVFALLVGVAGEAVFLYADNVKLNFLNFAALPITFGIGVDYAVNVVQRYRADGSRDILDALRTTGGAVVLCSLTTTLGYLALIGSANRAIRSLGVIAVVGEVSCLLAAVTVLPALWYLVERRRRPETTSTSP